MTSKFSRNPSAYAYSRHVSQSRTVNGYEAKNPFTRPFPNTIAEE